MKKIKKFLLPIFISVICGGICGKLVFDIYEPKTDGIFNGKKVYLVQIGTYSDYDNMTKSINLSKYVYYEDDGKYKAIIGITMNKNNIDKIISTYNGEVIVSEYYSTDSYLNDKIIEYDKKLSSASDNQIKDIVNEMLSFYKGRDDNVLLDIS